MIFIWVLIRIVKKEKPSLYFVGYKIIKSKGKSKALKLKIFAYYFRSNKIKITYIALLMIEQKIIILLAPFVFLQLLFTQELYFSISLS